MTIHFGSDGWRGVIADDITFGNVRRVAAAYAALLRSEQSDRQLTIVVGYDRRFLSDQFASAMSDEISQYGLDVWLCDAAVPSAVVAFAVRDMQADGGLIVTASHHPPEYNGIKLRDNSGGPLKRTRLDRIESLINEPLQEHLAETPGSVNQFDPRDRYLNYLAGLFPISQLQTAGLTVAVDAMFGTAAGLLPRLLDGEASRCVEISTAHNPIFPGLHAPEPIERTMGRLRKIVSDGSAHIGFAFDGAAERLAVVDDNGEYVGTQYVFALLAHYMMEVRGVSRPIVKAVTGTSMIPALARDHDVSVVETRTGFAYIAGAMLDGNASLAGEENGGFAFGFSGPDRDGLITALALLDLLLRTGKRLSELRSEIEQRVGPRWYRRVDLPLSPSLSTIWNNRLDSSDWPSSIAGVAVVRVIELDGIKFQLEDGSWLLIREAESEPLIRIYAESVDEQFLDVLLDTGRQMLMS